MPACIVAFGAAQVAKAKGLKLRLVTVHTYLGKNVDLLFLPNVVYVLLFCTRDSSCPKPALPAEESGAKPNRSRPPALSLTSTGCFFYYLFSATDITFFSWSAEPSVSSTYYYKCLVPFFF